MCSATVFLDSRESRENSGEAAAPRLADTAMPAGWTAEATRHTSGRACSDAGPDVFIAETSLCLLSISAFCRLMRQPASTIQSTGAYFCRLPAAHALCGLVVTRRKGNALSGFTQMTLTVEPQESAKPQ